MKGGSWQGKRSECLSLRERDRLGQRESEGKKEDPVPLGSERFREVLKLGALPSRQVFKARGS